MFCRRVFASNAIPRCAYSSLHINSRRQALRRLPSFVMLTPLLSTSTSISLLTSTQEFSSAMSALETCASDSISFIDLLRCLSPMQLSVVRLLELWGIAKGVTIKIPFCVCNILPLLSNLLLYCVFN